MLEVRQSSCREGSLQEALSRGTDEVNVMEKGADGLTEEQRAVRILKVMFSHERIITEEQIRVGAESVVSELLKTKNVNPVAVANEVIECFKDDIKQMIVKRDSPRNVYYAGTKTRSHWTDKRDEAQIFHRRAEADEKVKVYRRHPTVKRARVVFVRKRKD